MTEDKKQPEHPPKRARPPADTAACFLFLALVLLYCRNHAVFLKGLKALFSI